MSELDWLFPDSTEAVRQGDALLRRDPSSGAILESCLVITADCDISKKKFGYHLACLRMESLNEYIRFDWARGKFNKLIANESDRVRSQLAKWHTIKLGCKSNLSVTGIEEWIRRDSTDLICASLDVPLSDRKKLAVTIENYKAALNASEACDKADFLTRLVVFKAALSRTEIDECLKEALTQAQKESLPDDVFLLPSLPHTDKGAVLVKLREVTAVDFELIKYRSTEADLSRHYLRTGRLQPTLKYAISQKFGALYSRIGLSSDFEDRHKMAIESVFDITMGIL